VLAAILEGLFFGFVLSFMLGPSFFLILETSIQDGIKSAMLLDLGVLVSDIIYIFVALKFFSRRDEIIAHEQAITIATGVLLGCFGAYQLLTKKAPSTDAPEPKEIIHTRIKSVGLFLKGFLINIINPTILLYWFGMIFIGFSKNNFDDSQMIVFLGSILAAFFSIDVLKIIGARQLKKAITPALMRHLNRAIGVILVVFGAVLFIKGLHIFH